METINDLYNEFVSGCGTEAPTRTQDEVRDQFHTVGGRNYHRDGRAFLDAAFDDGHDGIGEWPWGGPWTGATEIGLAMEPLHVTAIRSGSVYGHASDHCDAAGCAGAERYLGPLNEWPGVERGRVYERDEDGFVSEVVDK